MVSNKFEQRNIITVVERHAQTEYDMPAPTYTNPHPTCPAEIKLLNQRLLELPTVEKVREIAKYEAISIIEKQLEPKWTSRYETLSNRFL